MFQVSSETATPAGATDTRAANNSNPARTLAPYEQIRLVVLNSDNTIQVVDPELPIYLTYNPAFTGLLQNYSAVNDSAYLIDPSTNTAIAVNENGSKSLDFITNPTYGLALWRGGEGYQGARLAWGTKLDDYTTPGTVHPFMLKTSLLDRTQLEILLTDDQDSFQNRTQFVALAWSADGETLFFSREPVGIGGYTPLIGVWSLYKIDITTKVETALIPLNPFSAIWGCLDALSQNYRLVAKSCAPNSITLHNLGSGVTTTILPPAEVNGYTLMGSSSFSPTGDRVAFAMAARNPSNEQGWVAVSEGTSGASRLVLSPQPGFYYTIPGWLDDQTLLVQYHDMGCANGVCNNQVWKVPLDNSQPVKLADGLFLSILDNR